MLHGAGDDVGQGPIHGAGMPTRVPVGGVVKLYGDEEDTGGSRMRKKKGYLHPTLQTTDLFDEM